MEDLFLLIMISDLRIVAGVVSQSLQGLRRKPFYYSDSDTGLLS
jgi:hypothetical protein